MQAAFTLAGVLVLRSGAGDVCVIDKQDARYRLISDAMKTRVTAKNIVVAQREPTTYEKPMDLPRYQTPPPPPERYDKGWVPGPNANWQKRSPDEMAKSLSSGRSKQSSSPQSLATKPQNPQSQVGTRPPEKPPAPAPTTAAPPQAEDVAKMDDAQLSKLIEQHSPSAQNAPMENKANPEKPKRVRDRANEPHNSLREVVKKFGGINIGSLEATGFDVKALMESGLAWRGLFKRDGGLDVSEMAGQLHNEGHIEIPGVEHHGEVKGANASKTLPKEAAQFMLDNLVAKVKSLHAIKDAEFKKSYQNYLRELKNAEADESEVSEAVRSGEGDGQTEGANPDSLGDDSGMANEGGGQGDETGATEVGDFDPSKFQHPPRNWYAVDDPRWDAIKSRYNKGWVPGPDAHWQKVHPDEMAKRLGRRTVPDELQSRKGPAQTSEPKPEPKAAPAAEQPQAAPQGGIKPLNQLISDLPRLQQPSAPPAPAQPAAPPEKPQAAALTSPTEPKEKVAHTEAMGLYFDKLPVVSGNWSDFGYGQPKIVVDKVKSLLSGKNRNADQAELFSRGQEAVMNAALSMNVGDTFEAFKNKALASINNAFKSEGRGQIAQKRDSRRTKEMEEGFDAAQEGNDDVGTSLDVNEAVGKLSPQRQGIVKAKTDGHTFAQIGEQFGISAATAYREYESALDVLRQSLASHAKPYEAEGVPTRYMNTEHVPAGSPEGGQFTGKGEHGQSPDDMAKMLSSIPLQTAPLLEGEIPKSGQPISFKAYRGTNPNGKPNDHGVAGKGEYWSGDKNIAQEYKGPGGEIKESEISLKNPLVMSYPELDALQKKVVGRVLNAGTSNELSQQFDSYLRSQGHDGVALFDKSISLSVPQEVVVLQRNSRDNSPTRYLHGPLLHEVWQEILTQARDYGPMGPEFIRSVMEAMQHTDSQWEAIQEGRRAFLRHGSQRHAKDAAGHEHLPSGSSEGGQFTGKAEHGQSPDQMAAKVPAKQAKATPEQEGIALGDEIAKYSGVHAGASGGAALGSANVVSKVLAKHKFAGKITSDDIAVVLDETKILGSGLNSFGEMTMTVRNDKAMRQVLLAAKTGQYNGKKVGSYFDLLDVAEDARKRYEYGPRHQPKKRLDGAVARLSALAEYAGEIDDEALEDEVIGISREFSAEDLKAIARAFGIKRGISTKAKTLESLLDKVCEGKGE